MIAHKHKLVFLACAFAALVFYLILFNTPVFTEKPKLLSGTSTTTSQCDTAGKMCPDGSVVTRTGPLCQFAECPIVSNSIEQVRTKYAELRGTVTLSPTCPVERMPPDPACAPQPYDTEVFALRKDTGAIAAQTRTDNGTYVLELSAGIYIIRAASGAVFPKCTDFSIGLANNDKQTINISCDSGIR